MLKAFCCIADSFTSVVEFGVKGLLSTTLVVCDSFNYVLGGSRL